MALSDKQRVAVEAIRDIVNGLLAEPAPAPEERRWLGTNLSEVAYWGTQFPFRNIFKTAGPWKVISKKTWRPTEDAPHVDERGWVTSIDPDTYVRALLLRNGGVLPEGQYHVLYDGKGHLDYEYAGKRNKELSETGHDVVDVTPSNQGIAVCLYATDPADPVRNIRVYFPGEEDWEAVDRRPEAVGRTESGIFRGEFLESLRGYACLRFMDWLRTNNSEMEVPSQMPSDADAVYTTRRGVPLSVCLWLAGSVDADPWICIPHKATSDLIDEYADQCADWSEKHPGRRVWVEYSNEVWNGGFAQAKWCEALGLQDGLSDVPSQARAHYYAGRSCEIFQRFRAYLGDDHVVCVLGSQAANTGLSRRILGWKDAAELADVLAIAPYFGGIKNAADLIPATLDCLFEYLEEEGVPQSIKSMEIQAEVATEYEVGLVAYEGGQHLVAGNKSDEGTNALFDAANRDARMGELYTRYLEAWREVSGDGVMCHFNDCGPYTGHGRWGAMEFLGQEGSVKAAALRAAMQNAK